EEIVQLRFGPGKQRTDSSDSGVVDQPIQPRGLSGQPGAGGTDGLGIPYVERKRGDARQLRERVEVGWFARRCVDVMSEAGEPFGEIATDPGARSGDEDGARILRRVHLRSFLPRSFLP